MAAVEALAQSTSTENTSAVQASAIERPRVIQALHSEHIYMSSLLNTLEEQVEAMAAGQHADINLILDIVHYMKSFPDQFHHPREDIVYELLAEREKSIRALLLDLRSEHAQLDSLAGQVADCMDDIRLFPTAMKKQHAKKLSTNYIAMLRHHMDQEEAGVLPIASRVLTDKDWQDIEQKTARYEKLPTNKQVAGRIAQLQKSLLQRADKAKEDILLAEFLTTTGAMETAGALAQGLGTIVSAANTAAKNGWVTYTNVWRAITPGLQLAPTSQSWVETWDELSFGVKQVTVAGRLLRDDAIMPRRNGVALFKTIASNKRVKKA